ncbi:uncharacterized protein CC84DRAFT_1188618 [Paraphaeosphaeria sporulosa]|uniref:Alpha/beta-hydrolase n=1 Tax=Paraphaeosphaeria sporulosa TaxID=1460663 RepID=A0A177C9V6_9PLEO|nr:uncharacterized protein CC84DRAFT_1188618 [Paraphaeosphaeria sporulosa]OAG04166.1 hypothetical protein CC84DRAFT_1188618 [Paraphaeosphaeria sporulosa]
MDGHATAAAGAHQSRQNALADIHFASIMDADLTPSEDETPYERTLQLETVQSAIGISIGQQQTRLTSPKTPAAEKAAALEDSDGGALFEGWEQPPEPSPLPIPREFPRDPPASRASAQTRGAEASEKERPARLPSPWRAQPKTFTKQDNHRAALRDTLNTKSRRRTMSGGASDYLKKYIPFNLPSIPKTSSLLNFSLPSFSVSSFDNVGRHPYAHAPQYRNRVSQPMRRGPSETLSQHDGTSLAKPIRGRSRSRSRSLTRPQNTTADSVSRQDSSPETGGDTEDTDGTITPPEAPKPEVNMRPPPILRRSNSEGSLLLYRSRSIASSLGDDSRFEHVSEQVNSRLKAIKDSWQDSNFKLSVPSMPNFSFSSREDLFRKQSGTSTPRAANASLRRSGAKVPSADARGTGAGSAASHPYFTAALNDLEGDLVILGGYRGSILRSAEPPHRQLWVPIKVGLNLRKVDLEIGLHPEDEETMEERIIPGGMLTHIGPVDIAKRLFKRLRASENARNGHLRVHDYGYDWRLSPHLLSRRMIKFLENLPCNQPGVPPDRRGAIVVAHSLGGLITRHVINQRPDLVAGVVYAGVPQRCINILGPFRNGDDVLLSSRVLTAQVNFTIRTSYALLPLDGQCFINKHTKEQYRVDFFDPKMWEEYRLSPCIAPAIPVAAPAPTSNLSVSGLLNAMSQALPTLPGRKNSMSTPKGDDSNTGSSGSHNSASAAVRDTARNAVDMVAEGGAQATGFEPKMQTDVAHSSPSSTSTIPHDQAVAYLTRTLAEIKQFKEELDHRPEHTSSNAYPPIALIYGKSTPTVYGAKVESREAIKLTSAYDELAFASGDGVVLAKAAMVPQGYRVVRGGVVPSERGHVTLLGDLEAVGRCLFAVMGARKRGIGLGEAALKGRAPEKGETMGVTF